MMELEADVIVGLAAFEGGSAELAPRLRDIVAVNEGDAGGLTETVIEVVGVCDSLVASVVVGESIGVKVRTEDEVAGMVREEEGEDDKEKLLD